MFSVKPVRLFIVVSGLASFAVQAHTPFFVCQAKEQVIHCEAGYTDNSGAEGAVLEVLAMDDTSLLTLSLDDRSQARFARPARDFYLLLSHTDNHGDSHVIELEMRDIAGLAP